MKAVLIDHMGDDLKIVNAARASFGTKSKLEMKLVECPVRDSGVIEVWDLAEKDKNLLRYLARGIPTKEYLDLIDSFKGGVLPEETVKELLNKYRGISTHWVPFAHCYLTFEVTMPMFVKNQLIRHTIGVTISEQSRRYVSEDPEYWFPEITGWRIAAANVKQGSSDMVAAPVVAGDIDDAVRKHCEDATKLYRDLVDNKKIAPEMARMILPQNMMLDWTWTISLVTAARICRQRLDPHAQKEIQVLVKQVYDACMQKFPVAFKALMDFGDFDTQNAS